MLAQQELLAAQLIQGYASQEQLKTYQSLSKEGQSLINKSVASQSNISDVRTDFDELEKQAQQYIVQQAEAGKLSPNGEKINTAAALWMIQSEEMMKALYASEKLGWSYNQKAEE